MTWHAVLVGFEQSVVWATGAGIVGTVFAVLHRRPLKRLLGLLDTNSPGGLGDVVTAIENSSPPPNQPRQR